MCTLKRETNHFVIIEFSAIETETCEEILSKCVFCVINHVVE